MSRAGIDRRRKMPPSWVTGVDNTPKMEDAERMRRSLENFILIPDVEIEK